LTRVIHYLCPVKEYLYRNTRAMHTLYTSNPQKAT
jgi:hypothetical protein